MLKSALQYTFIYSETNEIDRLNFESNAFNYASCKTFRNQTLNC